METFEDKKLISEFNSAKFQVFRINLRWDKINEFRDKSDLLNWAKSLDMIWDEMISKVIKRGDLHYIALINEIDAKIHKIKSKRQRFEKALRLKHQLLKVIEERVGLGGRMKDSDEDEMDE